MGPHCLGAKMALFLVLVVHAGHQAVDFRKCCFNVFSVPICCRKGTTCSTRRPGVLCSTGVEEKLASYVRGRHPCSRALPGLVSGKRKCAEFGAGKAANSGESVEGGECSRQPGSGARWFAFQGKPLPFNRVSPKAEGKKEPHADRLAGVFHSGNWVRRRCPDLAALEASRWDAGRCGERGDR